MPVRHSFLAPHTLRSRGHSVRLNCDWCDKEFKRPLSHYDRAKKHFCSRVCRSASRHIEKPERVPRPSRRTEVRYLLLTALSTKEIAAKMNIHVGTVKFHCASIYKDNGVQDRIGLMAKYLENNT